MIPQGEITLATLNPSDNLNTTVGIDEKHLDNYDKEGESRLFTIDSSNEYLFKKHQDHYLTDPEQSFPWYSSENWTLDVIQPKIHNFFYVTQWLPNYNYKNLLDDFIAGIGIAAMTIPQTIAYSSIVGIAPDHAMLTGLVGQLVFPFFGTARHLTLGASAVGSIISFQAVSTLATENKISAGSDDFLTYVNTLAFVSAIVFLIMALFRVGKIASFLAYPVIIGFNAAVSFVIGATQIKPIFGLTGPKSGTFIDNCRPFNHLNESAHSSIGFFILSFSILLFLKYVPRYWPKEYPNPYLKYFKYIPGPFFVLLLGILITYISKDPLHVKRVGEINVDLFKSIPVDLHLISKYPSTFITNGIIIPIILFAQHIAVGVNFGMKYEYDVIPSQELYSNSIANFVGCLVGVYPISGVVTHPPIAEDFGAKTLLFNWISAFFVFFAILMLRYLPKLLYYLPKAILSGIVINACIGIFPYAKIIEIAKVDTRDVLIMVGTFFTTIFWGLAEGVGMGLAISAFLLVLRSSKPHCAVLGRILNTKLYHSVIAWPEAITTNGIISFRFDGILYFNNTTFFKQVIQILMERCLRNNKLLLFFILDCQSINDIDYSGQSALEAIHKMLKEKNIVLILTGCKYPVLKTLKRTNLVKIINENNFFNTVYDAHLYIYQRLKFNRGEKVDFQEDYIVNNKNLLNLQEGDSKPFFEPIPEQFQLIINQAFASPLRRETQRSFNAVSPLKIPWRDMDFHINMQLLKSFKGSNNTEKSMTTSKQNLITTDGNQAPSSNPDTNNASSSPDIIVKSTDEAQYQD